MPEDITEILKFMQTHIDERFDRVDDRFAQIDSQFSHIDVQFKEVFDRLDRMEFLLTGQERRLSTLEDRVRIMATKMGLEFHPHT